MMKPVQKKWKLATLLFMLVAIILGGCTEKEMQRQEDGTSLAAAGATPPSKHPPLGTASPSTGNSAMPGAETPTKPAETSATPGETSKPTAETSTQTAKNSTQPEAETAGYLDDLRLETLVQKGTFNRPVGLEKRPDRPDQLYVVEQGGTIRLLDLNQPQSGTKLVLDIRDRVRDDGNEKGLLGLAFHPAKPGEAYVNYTTDTHTVISRFTADQANGDRLDPKSEQVILTFKQPRSNHNGGQLAFGPDGMLYIASGDGGGSGDPYGSGQDKQSLLGKILRIDVDRQEGDRAYAIPDDNPFANGGGAPEVYAYGLRNPWRFSFDTETGQLWAADVGQNRLEEINLIVNGGNYGWNVREGTQCYKPAKGCATEGLIDPIYEYGRNEGVSVTGGFVYRGKQIPALNGWYVYGDYAMGTIWALRQHDGRVENRKLFSSGLQISSFGTDVHGEIYVVAHDGGIHRIAAG
jgi:glucose/arabinose dehydrogenase